MSAFLMSEESISDLAYNIFTKGKCHSKLSEYFETHGITCPEELFKKLRWENIKSINVRYGERKTKKHIGEYQFSKHELTLVELVKKINCWQYQSCESDSVVNGKLYKILTEFMKDCCIQYLMKSEEYSAAEWN